MLKIKLVRVGKRNQPHYRIVVQEAKTKLDGKYTAKLGHYAPNQTPKLLEVDLKEYREWLSKGAQPTKTVASLVKRFESDKPFPPKKAKLSKKKIASNLAAEKEAAKTKEAVAEPEVVEEVKTEESQVETKTEETKAE